jgi:ABC-type sulfate/molybdate transport systems ATPase subunit
VGAVVGLRNVRHRRGGHEVLAIDELDLRAGERLAVLGPNGAGKTTLLRLMAGLEAPTTGRVEVDGEAIAGAEVDLRRRIGYATQRPGLLSTSVIRNVELPLRWRGLNGESRRTTALAALERLGVASLADRKALSLSGGEAQRVSLARSLAIEPGLLLLDEPAAGLDAEVRRAFFDDLEGALSDRATTVVHVSHRAEEALRLADRVAVLTGGRIRQLGDPTSVVRQPADGTVAHLLGYENVIPVQIDASGHVLVDGSLCGISTTANPGAATLATWGTAIRLDPAGDAPMVAVVKRISPRAGRWEVTLDAGETLIAHLTMDQATPAAGDEVGVRIDEGHAVLIPDQPVSGPLSSPGRRSSSPRRGSAP